jgi:NO-binding membrane sensor protein with MHYT domain
VYGVAHEPWIVILSILVAIQGSYVALGLMLRVTRSEGLPRRLNLAAAAVSFAISIWSMHFVAMLAMRVPFRLDYLVLPTLLSFLVCVFVVGMAVFIVSYAPVWRPAVPIAGLMMGIGIATMHYIGMLALRDSALMQHDLVYVAASFAVAIVASTLALQFAFAPRRGLPVAPAAVLFGLAISGMHYVAMAGLTMAPSGDPAGQTGATLTPDLLAVVVSVVAFAVSAVFLLTLVPDHGPLPGVALPVAKTAMPGPHVPTLVPATAALEPVLADAGMPMPLAVGRPMVGPPAIGPLGGAGGTPRRTAHALPVERDGATHFIPVEKIVLVQASAHYTSVFDGRTHSFCSLSIGEVEARLDPTRFLRVHRSYIVAIDRIACLRRTGDGGTAQFDTPTPVSVPVSRGRYPSLKSRVGAGV